MSPEMSFRCTLGLVVVITFAVRMQYSRNGTRRGVTMDTLQMAVTVASLGWVLTTIAYVLGLGVSGEALAIPRWMRIAGAVGMLVSIVISAWVYKSLGKQFFIDLRISADHELITEGPYRYVRHPMYSALFLSVIGSMLLSANIVVLGMGILLIAVICVRIPREEAMLAIHFGLEYSRYKERTGSLLPRLH